VMIRMEDASAVKRKMFHYFMAVAKKVGAKILDGDKSVGVADRLLYALGSFFIYAPLRNVLGMSRVRVAYTAGEAIGPDLFSFYRSLGINLKQLYGSTETCVLICIQPSGQVKPDTVGPPVPGVEIKLTESGEVLVKTPGIFKEYYKRPDATAEVFDAEGWYHTGDAGYFDKDGHLKIIDRVKDVGKMAGGALFAPKYVENKLKFFQYIKEAVVFGDGRNEVTAFVNIDLEAVGNWAERRNLAYSGYTDLAQQPSVVELITGCVEQVNRDLSKDTALFDSQIRRFLILHKELDPDDDELTRTRKVRRGFIAEKYKVLIDALYSGKPSQYIETQVKFEDGRTGLVSADIKIQNVQSYAATKAAA
jgi:long-chain acyl-CoA synthetase